MGVVEVDTNRLFLQVEPGETIQNRGDLLKNCPPEFYNPDNKWRKAVIYFFQKSMSGTLSEADLKELEGMKAPAQEIATMQYRFLIAWLTYPKVDEDSKFAVGAWLLAGMLPHCPRWGR